jgi:hypothetical protein
VALLAHNTIGTHPLWHKQLKLLVAITAQIFVNGHDSLLATIFWDFSTYGIHTLAIRQ